MKNPTLKKATAEIAHHSTIEIFPITFNFEIKISFFRPGSKMKCNALECLLKIQAQKGVANEKVPSINSMGKNKDSDVKAIGVLINEDCRSA